MRKIHYSATVALALTSGVGAALLTAQYDRPTNPSHEGLHESDVVSEKLILLEQHLNTIISTVIEINKHLETVDPPYLQSINSGQILQEEGIASDRGVADIPENSTLSKDEENAIKDNILSSLYYPDTTLQTVMNSKELDSLPVAMRQEVFAEIARLIDSGSVDLARFLPGYRAHEEKTN